MQRGLFLTIKPNIHFLRKKNAVGIYNILTEYEIDPITRLRYNFIFQDLNKQNKHCESNTSLPNNNDLLRKDERIVK